MDCPKNSPNAGRGHKNRYSGKCPLNPTEFTIPQLGDPNQPPAGLPVMPPYPPTNPTPYPVPPTNPEVTRATSATFPFGVGQNIPNAPYMVDTTQWPYYERQRWMEQEVEHLRRTNAVNSRNSALANLPDSFKNIDTTRKTRLVQETEEEEEEGDLEEDKWIEELRKQEALQEEEYLRENNDIGEAAEYSNDNTNESPK